MSLKLVKKIGFALVIQICILHSSIAISQARVVINNNAYIAMNGGTNVRPVYLVIDNSAANALTTVGTGGNLKSENEYNRLRWHMGNVTGDFRIPFTTTTNVKIPYRMQVTTAGTPSVANPYIDFATFPTTTMNNPRPSMVTHMTDAATGSIDNSLWVIDRFWISDAMSSYSTRPATTIDFGYNAAETVGNNLLPGNMVAQRFNPGPQTWNGSVSMSFLSWGTDNGVNSVSNAVIPPAELFQAWTLSEQTNLLPVSLLYFNAQCDDGSVALKWATASETNTSHFDVEKTTDGYNWDVIYTINAQGNSSSEVSYQARDFNTSSTLTYYRLKQVDLDGQQELFDMQSISACGQETNAISVYQLGNGQYQVNVNSIEDQTVALRVRDVSGKEVVDVRTLNVVSGSNVFLFDDSFLASAMYIVSIENQNVHFSDKLIIQK